MYLPFLIYAVLLPAVLSQGVRRGGKVSPCQLSDIPCIRYFLARNSNCDPNVWGSIPNVIRFSSGTVETPNFNTTFVHQYMTVYNLNKCYVSAFTFNPDTNRVVLAITCPNITLQFRRQLIFHEPLKQDQIYDYRPTFYYPPIIFTVDFARADKIDLCDSYVFPYITGIPKINIIALDPESAKFRDENGNGSLDHLSLYAREECSQFGNRIYRQWVNNVLCNFDDYCTD